MSYFTDQSGSNDAQHAIARAEYLAQPNNTPIYFAVDSDPTQADLQSNISDYFASVSSILGNAAMNPNSYKLGIYGSCSTCTYFKALYPTAYTMLANPHGTFNNYNIIQSHHIEVPATTINNNYIPAINIDPDQSSGNSYGGWKHTTHKYSLWSNYGNAVNHRRRCFICGHYQYQYHVPNNAGNKCTVCGYTGTIVIPTNSVNDEE